MRTLVRNVLAFAGLFTVAGLFVSLVSMSPASAVDCGSYPGAASLNPGVTSCSDPTPPPAPPTKKPDPPTGVKETPQPPPPKHTTPTPKPKPKPAPKPAPKPEPVAPVPHVTPHYQADPPPVVRDEVPPPKLTGSDRCEWLVTIKNVGGMATTVRVGKTTRTIEPGQPLTFHPNAKLSQVVALGAGFRKVFHNTCGLCPTPVDHADAFATLATPKAGTPPSDKSGFPFRTLAGGLLAGLIGSRIFSDLGRKKGTSPVAENLQTQD